MQIHTYQIHLKSMYGKHKSLYAFIVYQQILSWLLNTY